VHDAPARILVVDDVPENIRALREVLKADAEVAFAREGSEALAKAFAQPPDLVLLDVQMEGMDGHEVCRRLKADPRTAHVPVIFVTGMSDERNELLALGEGAIDYVTKPFKPEVVRGRVRNQLALARAMAEIRRLNQALTQALQELQRTQAHLVEREKLASLGSIVAGVAHEISTPIGVGVTAATHLRGLVDRFRDLLGAGALKRSDLEAFMSGARESSELVHANLARAAELVSSFKQVAVDGSCADSVRRLEVGSYLRTVLTTLGPTLRAAGIEAHVECGAPVDLECDAGALTQVVTNLVTNVVLHAYPPGGPGRLTLTGSRSGADVLIACRDEGVGIAPEVKPRVFEPFFTTRRGQGGTGLGLHIAHNLVTRKLQGSLEVESEPGRGARFVVRLPATAVNSTTPP
jgi:signal transduction histidine kinase